MENLAKIKKENFITWYFKNSGDDLVNNVWEFYLRQLKINPNFKMDIKVLFKECNKYIIPAMYFEGFNKDDKTEIGVYTKNIILID